LITVIIVGIVKCVVFEITCVFIVASVKILVGKILLQFSKFLDFFSDKFRTKIEN